MVFGPVEGEGGQEVEEGAHHTPILTHAKVSNLSSYFFETTYIHTWPSEKNIYDRIYARWKNNLFIVDPNQSNILFTLISKLRFY